MVLFYRLILRGILIQYRWWFWNNFFSRKQIIELYDVFDKNGVSDFKDNPSRSDAGGSLKNVSLVKSVHWQHIHSYLKLLDEQVKRINRDIWGYHLDENFSTSGVLSQQYESSDDYDWHQDGSNSENFDSKFTVVINSSLERFEGGELEIFTQGGILPLRELRDFGSVVMFPSHVPHRVTGVTKGIRNTIVYWKEGPRFV